MIRIDDAGVEGIHATRCLLFGHRVRKIHGNERDVDIAQCAHFRDVLRVPGDVDPGAANGDDVTVTPAFVVEPQPILGEVVRRNSLDPDLGEHPGLAVGQRDRPSHQRGGELLGHRCRRHDGGLCRTDRRQGLGVHVITVDIRDQNEVWGGEIRESTRPADGVDVNRFAVPSHDEGGVVEWKNDHVAT